MDSVVGISGDDLWRALFKALLGDGRLILGPLEVYIESPPLSLLEEMIENAQELYPGDHPQVDVEALQWAARMVGVASHLVVNRYQECDVLQKVVDEAPEISVSSIFYADILLQVLPDIWKLSTRKSEEDTLVKILLSVAEQWPLSCMGMLEAIPDESVMDVICSERSLLIVFVDRMMARENFLWLEYDPIRKMVMEMMGDMWIDHVGLTNELKKYDD